MSVLGRWVDPAGWGVNAFTCPWVLILARAVASKSLLPLGGAVGARIEKYFSVRTTNGRSAHESSVKAW